MIDKPFDERLKDGKEFEDFAAMELYRVGLPFFSFGTRRFQWAFGEGVARVEIKLDRQHEKYGNVFIETRERRNTTGSNWREAGIYDAARPWIYVVGNEKKIWVFATSILIILHKTNRYAQKVKETAEGFVMPIRDADKYSIGLILPVQA